MTSPARFSIRRLLAMVAVVAGLCASLHYANGTTVLVVQTCFLIALVSGVILAVAGSPRTRKFCLAGLAAGLIHLFLLTQNPVYDTAVPFTMPTSYACYWLWNWVKVDVPMTLPTPTPVYAAPPTYTYVPAIPYASSSPSTVPPSYSSPPPLMPVPASVPTTATEPDPGADPSPRASLVPRPILETVVSADGNPVQVPSWTEDEMPADPFPPPTVVPPSSAGGPYGSWTTVMPMVPKPDRGIFMQIGILEATLLIGLVAGSAAVMLDDFRRRRVRARAAGEGSKTS
jgi:hypothetical protein